MLFFNYLKKGPLKLLMIDYTISAANSICKTPSVACCVLLVFVVAVSLH